MLEKTLPKAFRHILKLKDVKIVKATFKDNDGEQIIVCPVSQREMNGFHPFVIIWGCGCLISEEACKELKIADACLSCSHKISNSAEIVSLNQSPEQQAQYLEKFDEAHKKVKKTEEIPSMLGKRSKNEQEEEKKPEDKQEDQEPKT